jgi:DNA repair exonuclease SbcCD ATPase subunit
MSDENLEQSNNQEAVNDTVDNSKALKELESFKKDYFKLKDKFKTLAEFSGIDGGMSHEELTNHLASQKTKQEQEKQRMEEERKGKLSELEIIKEEFGGLKSTLEQIQKEKADLENKAKFESRKSEVQKELIANGVIEDYIGEVTDLFLLKDSGKDVKESVAEFKNNRLGFFKSNANEGNGTTTPSENTTKTFTGKIKGSFGNYV